MSLGEVAMQSKSSKQKFNTHISTKSKIVRVENHMSGILWIMQFLEPQVYKVYYNVIYQDNQSAMIMKKWEIFIW